MPSLVIPDLKARLHQAAATALDEADANNTNVLARSEEANLDPEFREYVRAYRSNVGRVDVPGFVDAFDAFVDYHLGQANTDGNRYLDDREFARLPPILQRTINTVLGNVPSGPSTPSTPVTPQPPANGGAANGVFGIAGVIQPARVRLETILDRGLHDPSSLAFNPRDGSLWIVNRGNDGSVVIDEPGTARQRVSNFQDDSDHFMNNPTGIAFSPTRNEFATTQESTNDYNRGGTGNMFTGPTLWTADRRYYDGGAQSHLDMLHHSPLAMGICAGARRANDEREYWVFNGQSGSVDRYFFNEPHALGAHDHADGLTYRYGEGSLQRVPNVPSGMALDSNTGYLYIADTGNGRIARLNTRTSTAAAEPIGAWHGETPLYAVPGVQLRTVTNNLDRPSGLLLKGDKLVVADHATGHIKVFGTDGALIGDVDTGLGRNALTGIAEGPDGKLYALDKANDRLLRISIA